MDLHGWAALATVLLVLQAFVVCLVVGVVFYFIGRGLSYVLREVPKQVAIGRRYLAQGQAIVGRVCDSIAAPFIAVGAIIAQIRGVCAGVRKLFAA